MKFSPSYEDRNYVAQYYDDKPTKQLADPVAVSAGSTTPDINAEMHEGGKISGTVIDATSKAPIGEINVCTLIGLRAGSYRIQFSAGEGDPSYVSQYYDGQSSWEDADMVPVAVEATTSSIDVEMHKGGKISGTVIDAVSKVGAHYV